MQLSSSLMLKINMVLLKRRVYVLWANIACCLSIGRNSNFLRYVCDHCIESFSNCSSIIMGTFKCLLAFLIHSKGLVNVGFKLMN